MRVRMDWSGLRRAKWHEYLIRFALGGTVTVITGLIGREFGPVVAGLFLAFPAIFPASATLVERHEREKRHGMGRLVRAQAALDARGAALGSLGLLSFAALVWKALPSEHVVVVGLAALLAWLLVAVAAWWLRTFLRAALLSGRSARARERLS